MKNKKVIIMVIILIILVAAAILGYLYFNTDMFKTNKALFFKYLSNTKILDEEVLQKYKAIDENMKNSNYSSTGNITCSMSSDIKESNVANVNQLFTVKYNSLKNRTLKQDYSDFTLNMNNEDLITLRYLRDDKKYGLKMENVLRKYITIENTNLKELFKKFGVADIKDIPDSIPDISIEEFLKIDQNQLNDIKEKYGNVILNQLDTSKFTKVRNSDSSTTITLSLTEREIANIIKQELETLKNDDSTLNLIINKAALLGYTLNIDSLKTTLQENIDDINNNPDIKDNEFLNIAITEKGKEVTRIELKTIINENEEIKLSIDLSEKNKLTIYEKDSENNIKLDISYGYEANSLSINTDIYELDEQNSVTNNLGKIQYQINNYSENNITQNILISYNMEDANSTVQININDSKDLKQDVQIEKLTNDNMDLLNNKSKEELDKLFESILERIIYVYGDKLEDYSSLLENVL